jgi:hypothetical protein
MDKPAHRPKGTTKPLPKEKIPLIVEGFAKTFTVRRAAGYAFESPYHVKNWLEKGESDAAHEIQSDYSQLFFSVANSLTTKAAEYIKKLENCAVGATAIMWLLEKCLRDDYGQDSDDYKELVDLYKKLLESYRRLQESNPIQGVLKDGREMDSEGN